MPKRPWTALLPLLAACAPIGVASRPTSPQPAPPHPAPAAAPAPAASAATPAPLADDIAYYRQVSQSLASKDLATLKQTNFARFRRGSMLLHHAGDPAAEAALRPAITGKDLTVIHTAASAVVAEDAAHIGAHIILMNLDQDAGHAADAELHDALVAGMFHSILGSGDGRSHATAFVVYFVREEYDLVRALGGQVRGQSLDHRGERSYDILHVTTKAGTERDVYFDITEVFAEEAKRFGLDK
jgi:hypothetical protein